MPESSRASDTPDAPLLQLYEAYPYHDHPSTQDEKETQKVFLDEYGAVTIGGRTISGIISEVEEVTGKERSCLMIPKYLSNRQISIVLTSEGKDTSGNQLSQRLRLQGPALTDATLLNDRDTVRTLLICQALSRGIDDPRAAGNRQFPTKVAQESANTLTEACNRSGERHPSYSRDFAAIKKCIAESMEKQITCGSFNLNLNSTPDLKALPGLATFFSKKLRDKLKDRFNAHQIPDTVTIFQVTENFLSDDHTVNQGIEMLVTTILDDDINTDTNQAMRNLAPAFTSEGQRFHERSELDKQLIEWDFNVLLAEGVTGRRVPRNKSADLMSQELLDDINRYYAPGMPRLRRSTDRPWQKPTEFLTMEDGDVTCFRKEYLDLLSRQHKDNLKFSEKFECMSKYPNLKRKIESILAGHGSDVLAEARASGNDSPTHAEHLAKISDLEFAMLKLSMQSRESGEHNPSPGDIASKLPSRALAQWEQRDPSRSR